MRCFVISAERDINLLIEYQCPQCGAPATIEETHRLVVCRFCKVTSYLTTQNHFQYILPHNASESKDLFYFPYFRFKGMIFSVLPSKIDHRFLDVSQQAIASLHFPISLGLRSQAMTLKFVTPEIKGDFLKPRLSHEKMFEILENRFISGLKKQILHHAHIGETLSMIYAPFYMEKGVIYDAVLNRTVSQRLPDNVDIKAFKSGPATWKARFIPTLCPHCGWDLDGKKDSLVLFCKNCEKGWKPKKKGFKEIPIAHIPTDREETLYLPFWRIKAEVLGVCLKSHADLIRLANLPKVVKPEWEDTVFHFWGPAFKVRPQKFLKVATTATMGQLEEKLKAEIPKGSLHPVNLPISESVESLTLIVANFLKPRKALEQTLSQIKIKAKSALLVYIPFDIRHHEYLQPTLHLAINKNQLSLAKNL